MDRLSGGLLGSQLRSEAPAPNVLKAVAIMLVFLTVEAPTAQAQSLAGCYSRTYSRAHLAIHPDQMVTSMTLRLAPYNEQFNQWEMTVTVRGRAGTLYGKGICPVNSPTNCFAECDGASFSLKPLSARSIHLHLVFVRMSLTCGATDDENTQTLEAGTDDKIFRLDKAPEGKCFR